MTQSIHKVGDEGAASLAMGQFAPSSLRSAAGEPVILLFRRTDPAAACRSSASASNEALAPFLTVGEAFAPVMDRLLQDRNARLEAMLVLLDEGTRR